MPKALRWASASARDMSDQLLPSAPTATMGITRTPALLTATTALATSPVASSSAQARGFTAATTDVRDTGVLDTAAAMAGTVVMAGTAARSDAAQSAATTALRM